jgi:ABC-type antimicrobial peptide transport system ATPase subunit
MSNDKTFKVAGVSAVKGNYKVRFANDMSRIKVLIKTDHTDIELMELPSEMSKGQAAAFLKTTALVNKPEYLQAIETADAKYNQVETVKVTSAKPSLEKIKARGTKKVEAAVTAEDLHNVDPA